MIESGLLEAASRAVIEKEAVNPLKLFDEQGIAREAGRTARKLSPAARAARQTAEEFATHGAKPKIIDAVSEPVTALATKGKNPVTELATTGQRSLARVPAGGGAGGLPPTPPVIQMPDSFPWRRNLPGPNGTPAQNNLLKYLGLGGAGVAGAGGTAYALSGGEEPAAAPVPTPTPTPATQQQGGLMGMLAGMSPAQRNALIGGAGGALAGGLYGLMSPGEETVYDDMGRPAGTRRKSRLMSALRNAAVVGGLGAGAGGLYGAYRG